jgi:HEAT repeat protein
MYAAFLERLRAVPGVTLLAADAEAPGAPVPNYRITISGLEGFGGADADHKFGGGFEAEILLPSGTVRAGSYGSYTVEAAPGCATDPRAADLEVRMITCSDPEGVAAQLVGSLRKWGFPPDPALRHTLLTRLLDRSLDVLQRQQALLDLARFGGGYSGRKSLTQPDSALRDPAVIRGAVDLATTASDPKVRALVWTALRGTGNTSLIPPLLAALGRDADSEVRLTALGTLAGEFGADPRVQAAFTATAQRDTRPLVRALAHRAAGGPDAQTQWKQYVMESLKDPRRSPVERIEALFSQMNLGATSLPLSNDGSAVAPALDMLDDEAIRMLATALPGAAAESAIVRTSSYQLLGSLGSVARPAVTEMLLDILDSGNTSLRASTVEALGKRANRLNDARAYAMLEKLADTDPDPRMRQIAAEALKARSSLRAGGSPQPFSMSQRLGIIMSVMEAGPGVPDDMVGRPVIIGVGGPETVAQKAGVMVRDVLLEISGTPVPAGADITRMVEALPKGVDFEVLVWRFGQKIRLIARF